MSTLRYTRDLRVHFSRRLGLFHRPSFPTRAIPKRKFPWLTSDFHLTFFKLFYAKIPVVL